VPPSRSLRNRGRSSCFSTRRTPTIRQNSFSRRVRDTFLDAPEYLRRALPEELGDELIVWSLAVLPTSTRKRKPSRSILKKRRDCECCLDQPYFRSDRQQKYDISEKQHPTSDLKPSFTTTAQDCRRL
jgi:hypothetical protein